MLPKVKQKKLIKEKEFIEVAKEAKESFEEEIKYIYERKLKNGDNLSTRTYSLS